MKLLVNSSPQRPELSAARQSKKTQETDPRAPRLPSPPTGGTQRGETQRKRLPYAFRLLLGAVPGVRSLVLEESRQSLPFVALGLLLGITFCVIIVGWEARHNDLARLRISTRVELLDAFHLFILIVGYEVLRAALALKLRTPRRPWAPRMLAAAFLPSLLVFVMGPQIIQHWPRGVEALWWTSAVSLILTSPAFVYCLLEDRIVSIQGRIHMLTGWMLGLLTLLLLIAALLILRADVSEAGAQATRAMGFRLLPILLAP